MRIRFVRWNDEMKLERILTSASTTSLELDSSHANIRDRSGRRHTNAEILCGRVQKAMSCPTAKRIFDHFAWTELFLHATPDGAWLESVEIVIQKKRQRTLDPVDKPINEMHELLVEQHIETKPVTILFTPETFAGSIVPEYGKKSWLERIDLAFLDPPSLWRRKTKLD
jgi:hypothetical protein